jgi:hypothetical protein
MRLPDQVKLPYSEGYDYGIGVNFATGGPKNKAISGFISPVEGAAGAIVRFLIKRVQTTNEMEQTLDIAATADYGVSAFSVLVRQHGLGSLRARRSSLRH